MYKNIFLCFQGCIQTSIDIKMQHMTYVGFFLSEMAGDQCLMIEKLNQM